MNKWRYAVFGWVAWKVTKRYVRRKLPKRFPVTKSRILRPGLEAANRILRDV